MRSSSGESRDSGLDNHSRQGSEPSSESSTSEGHGENTEEVDGSGILLSERRGNFTSYTVNGDDNRIKSLEEQISQQEVSAVLIIYGNFFYIYFNISSHYLLFNSLSLSLSLYSFS